MLASYEAVKTGRISSRAELVSVERIDEEKKMLRIRTLLAGAGASLLAMAAGSGIAAAADLSTYEAPPASSPMYSPAPAWSWTGPYAGLVGGYAWGHGATVNDTYSSNGWAGGGFVGYNLQTNQHLVVGLEGDVMATGKSGSDGAGTTVKNPWVGTFRGRVGYAWDRFMVYGTGGVAVGGLNASGTVSDSTTKVGWTAGAGLEAALTDKVTARVEYRHTDLGRFTSGGDNFTSNDILVGVGFKF
jgi:outer membrane immunogenic protein